jgi:hypothetical protein
VTSRSCYRCPLSFCQDVYNIIIEIHASSSPKCHLDFSLNVMYGTMGLRQPNDEVDFKMDAFALGA